MPPVAAALATKVTILGVTAKVGTLVAIAASTASVVYSQVQAAQQRKAIEALQARSRGWGVTSREPAAVRRVIYGTQRVGGTVVYIASSGKKNAYHHQVIALAGHEVSAIRDIYLDDTMVPTGDDGQASSGKYYVPPLPIFNGVSRGPGVEPVSVRPGYGLVRVKRYLGRRDQQSDADLMSAKPTHWTAAHRLQGIAYVYVRFTFDEKKFSGVPNVSVIVDGKRVYDPRTGKTEFSNNPALCWLDYMTNETYGLGCALDEIDLASVIAAANICDEQVPLSTGGTEARYTCNGVFETSETPVSIIEMILSSMAGWAVYTGGYWHLRAGAHQPIPAADLTLGDARGELSVQTADSRRDICNGVKGTYISPTNNWQPSDYPSVSSSTYLGQDGERIWRDLELAFTISPTTAQRLAKIELERARRDTTVQLPLNLKGMQIKAGDLVTLTVDRYGWNKKLFEVTAWKFAVDGAGFSTDGSADAGPVLGVDVELRETDSAVWDWSANDVTPPSQAVDPDLPGAEDALSAPDNVVRFNIDGLRLNWLPVATAFVIGYRIRRQSGSRTSWEDAIPLHDGLITETTYELSSLPPGPCTLLIKAVAFNGLESDSPAVIQTEIGDPVLGNVLETWDEKAGGFTGTRYDCAVSGGPLVADGTTAMWATDSATAMWTSSATLMWGAPLYKAMAYEFRVTTAQALEGLRLTLDADITGDAHFIQYREASTNAMWDADGSTPMWSADNANAPIWTVGPWIVWLGELAMKASGSYDFRITCDAGPVRGRIDALSAIVDVPDIVQPVDDFTVSAGGSRLPLERPFSVIKAVNLTLQDNGSGARTARVIDKDAAFGPLIKCFDAAGAAVAGSVDAIIQGY